MFENNSYWINGEEVIKRYYLDDESYKELLLDGKLYPYDTSMKKCYCCHLDKEINGVYRIIARIDGQDYKCFYEIEDLKKLLFRTEEVENCMQGHPEYSPKHSIQPDDEGFIEYLRNTILPTPASQTDPDSPTNPNLLISRKSIRNKTGKEIVEFLKSDKNNSLLSNDDKIKIAFALEYSDYNPNLYEIGELIHDKRNLTQNNYEKYARKYIKIAKDIGYKMID